LDDGGDTNHAAELQQRMPIATGSRQARRFNTENRADLGIANRTQHALKAGTMRATRGAAEIVVDNLHVRPSKLAGTIS
jgi:hypothetical protein